MKFFVVPESSERCTGVIFVAGRVTPGLSTAMAGSSHDVILPSKICAIVSGVMLSDVMSGRLKKIAIGETYAGTWIGSAPHVAVASVSWPSSSVIAESVPANATPPSTNIVRPSVEPVRLYSTVKPSF